MVGSTKPRPSRGLLSLPNRVMRRSASALRRLRVACADAHAERRMSSSSAGPREEVRACASCRSC